jgi:hypothetical protein
MTGAGTDPSFAAAQQQVRQMRAVLAVPEVG